MKKCLKLKSFFFNLFDKSSKLNEIPNITGKYKKLNKTKKKSFNIQTWQISKCLKKQYPTFLLKLFKIQYF